MERLHKHVAKDAQRDLLLLRSARKAGRAVGAFTCYTLEAAQAVVAAAEEVHAPAIVLVSAASFRAHGGKRMATAFLSIARHSGSGLLVQLDHETDLARVREAAAIGLPAVMVDGSQFPPLRNAELVQAARAVLGNVAIEAELGRVEGDEDVVRAGSAGSLTDPAIVPDFVRSSGCDCLAVSVGNAHGRYARPPVLDLARLAEIAARTDVPLALHGASGLSDDQIASAVAAGVSKVNFNTELREELFRVLSDRLPAYRAGLDVLGLISDVTDALRRMVAAKMRVLGWRE